jgi:hypothetical protein
VTINGARRDPVRIRVAALQNRMDAQFLVAAMSAARAMPDTLRLYRSSHWRLDTQEFYKFDIMLIITFSGT